MGCAHVNSVAAFKFGYRRSALFDDANRLHAGLELWKRKHFREMRIGVIALVKDRRFRPNAHEAVRGFYPHIGRPHFSELKIFEPCLSFGGEDDAFRHGSSQLIYI